MNLKPLSSVIALALLSSSALTAFPPPAHAMGKKRQHEEAEKLRQSQEEREKQERELEAQINNLLQVIREQHAQINRSRELLKMDLRSEPVITVAEGSKFPSMQTLLEIVLEQNQEVVRLEKILADHTSALESTLEQRKKVAEEALKRAEELKNNPNMSTDPAKWIEQRCYGLLDAMDSRNELAQGRITWSTRCLSKRVQNLEIQQQATIKETARLDPLTEIEIQIATMSHKLIFDAANRTFTAGRWWYPSYGRNVGTQLENPYLIIAPTQAGEDCDQSISIDKDGNQLGRTKIDILDKYHLAAMCVTGCYTPDQKILFGDGYSEIGDAFNGRNMSIQSLSADSTLDDPRFETHEIQAYTVDVSDALQEVLDIETLSGMKLSITKNHPLLDSTGQMRRAETFVPGESLVLTDGSQDPIVGVAGRSYYGKVYNVRVNGTDPRNQIIASQGVLTGSVHFQNEGVKDLNRNLFRTQLPNHLF